MGKVLKFLFISGVLSIIGGIILMYQKTDDKYVLSVKIVPSPAPYAAQVIRVIDGDTIVVSVHGEKHVVRLLGIDAPESVDKAKPVACYGKEAAVELRKDITPQILLQSDASAQDDDKYHRLLRYIFLPDGTFLNKLLVEEGFAREYTYNYFPYNFQAIFRQAEKNAQIQRKGLWGHCPK